MSSNFLIIDDSPDDREWLATLVQDVFQDASLCLAANGHQMRAHLEELQPDCTLLDYRLGPEDGMALLPELMQTVQGRPIIVMTGQGSEEVAVQAIRAGADDYLVKSDISALSLETSIRNAVSRFEMREKLDEHRDALLRADRLDALGHLAANIAHDVNSALNTISYSVDLALESGVSEKAEEYLAVAKRSIRRAAEVTSRTLDFGSQTFHGIDNVDVAPVFANVARLAKGIEDMRLTLDISSLPQHVHVRCDAGQLQNALINLIMNARDASVDLSDGASEVVLEGAMTGPLAEEWGGMLRIDVRDQGAGMTEDVLTRCTDPFFTTKRQDRGTGLGLTIVHNFIKSAGGELTVNSTEGQGTTVSMILPTVDAAPAQAEA